MRAWLVAVGLLLLGQAASAADYRIDKAAWIDRAKKPPHPKLADIGVPREAAGAKLTSLGAFRPGGEDNVAQYRSADGEVFATIYIYRPTLADATLAAIATTEGLTATYEGVKRQAVTVTAAGGHPATAYRFFYGDVSMAARADISSATRPAMPPSFRPARGS